MIPMTNDLRKKVQSYIKNHIDISELIKDVDIKGEDLSFAIIKKLYRKDTDMRGCNFSNSFLGEEKGNNVQFSLINCDMRNCNFQGAKFVGYAFVRGCNAQNCNFRGADVSKASYEHTDFTNSTFCGIIMRLGTKDGIGCLFPKDLLEQLTKEWKNKPKIE